jgi:hypothetical protein
MKTRVCTTRNSLRLFTCLQSIALLLACFTTLSLRAQSADTAGLEVDIHDPSGALVPGASLSLINHATQVTRDGNSDQQGRYRFADIPIGDYTLTVNKDGFNDLVESGISLAVGQSATLSVALKVLNNNQRIDVIATIPMVDTNRTTTGETIPTMEIENLPSNGRNFTDFALTVPGVTPQATGGQGSGLSINGQRGRSNNIMIDGVENNGDLNGTVRQTLSQDAIAQFQVMTNQFLPEYGNAGGGLINVVTKTGTEQYHGDLFYFARNAVLNAHPYCFVANCPAPIFVQNDMGATLGGPIYKNKTVFFASVEYFGLNTNQIDQITPSTAADVNTILALRPLVFGGVKSISTSNSIPQSTTQTVASLRIDHTFNPKDTFTLRALYGHFDHNNPTLDSSDGVFSDVSNYGFDTLQAYNFTGIYTHIFTPNLLNELHIQASPQHMIQVPNDPTGPSLFFLSGLQIGRNTDFPTLLNENHFEGSDSLSWSKGNHVFKVGTDIDSIRANTSFPTDFAGIFNFTCVYASNPAPGFPVAPAGAETCVDSLESGTPYQYIQGFGQPKIFLPDWLLSGYAQDSWKILPRLSVNYGMRYDVDLQPQGYNNDTSNPIEAPLPKGIPRDYKNFSPRVGLAWGVDRDSKTVVRAGYGIFYDKIFLLVARNSLLARNVLNENTVAAATAQFLTGPFPQSTTYPSGTTVVAPTINSITKTLPMPYAEQASLYIDRALSKDWSIELGYLYVSGAKELKSANVNLGPPVILVPGPGGNTATECGGCPPTFQQTGRPYYSSTDLLNSNFTAIQEVGSWGHSRYNAFQGSIVHNATQNISLRSSWVWSKEIDDASDFTQAQQPDNAYDPHAERALGDEDQRNRFVGAAVYTVPYFRDAHNKAIRWILSDWVGSTIASVFSGSPQNITVGSDEDNDGNPDSDRPYIDGLDGLQGGSIVKRNAFRGPRQQNVSIRLQKRVMFHDSMSLEFSVEAFNTFNHTNFDSVNTVWGTAALPNNPDGFATPLVWGKVYHANASLATAPTNTFGAFNNTSSTSTTLPGQREVQLGSKFFF